MTTNMEIDKNLPSCGLCSKFLSANPKSAVVRIVDIYPTLPRLSAAAERGDCDQCEFLCGLLKFTFHYNHRFKDLLGRCWKNEFPGPLANARLEYFQSLPSEYQGLDWTKQCPIQISPDLATARSNYFSFQLSMPKFRHLLELGVKPGGELRGPAPATDPDPLSKESISKIHKVMDKCLEQGQHLSCSKRQQSPAPRRMINVMSGSTVRLVDTDGQNLKYATLSYCWGTSEQAKAARTLVSNVTERYISMDLKKLPKTLSDSIKVTRALEIKYLWIDSLCIVQDSGEWKEEALKMCQYYENSFITILPSTSVSADDGFLVTRPTHFTWGFSAPRIFWGFPKRSPSGEPQVVQLSYPQDWDRYDAVLKSTWATRAWTVQEHMLSSRILYFTEHGVITSCREHSLDDRGQLVDLNVPQGLYFLASSSIYQPGSISEGVIWNQWYDIVESFCMHNLTFQSDKIPAISGVVKKFSDAFGRGDASWGIFFSDLCRGLSWIVPSRRAPWPTKGNPDYERLADCKRDGVPSWTWAIFDGTTRIRFPPLKWEHNPVIREYAILQNLNLNVYNVPKLTVSGPFHDCSSLITALGTAEVVEAGIKTVLHMDASGPVKTPVMLTPGGFDSDVMAEHLGTKNVADLKLLTLLDVEYDSLRFPRELKRAGLRMPTPPYYYTTPVRQVYLLVLRPTSCDANGTWTEWSRLGVLTVTLEGTDSWEHRGQCNTHFEGLLKGSSRIVLV